MLTEGTATKTPEELEEAIELLGANINVNAGSDKITVNVNSLSRNFEETLALVEEILLEPRWDEEQFDLIKSRKINEMKRSMASPAYIGALSFYKIIYGENSILGVPASGTIESVESITMQDLKDFYKSNFSPSVTKMQVAGSIDKGEVMNALASLSENWESKKVELKIPKKPLPPEKGGVYFVDVPGAKQSVIYVGNAAPPRTDKDYFPATVMNYKLGGSFNGILNMILREEKGFTYGARSGFAGYKYHGNFTANSSVRSDATYESVDIFKTEIEKYIQGISDEDLQFTKDALLKSNARNFETLGALLNMLEEISVYNLPFNYVKQEEKFIRQFTPEQHKKLAQKLLNPEKMYFVIAGDAATQMEQLEKLGLGKPVLYEL
jgi:zinc protease